MSKNNSDVIDEVVKEMVVDVPFSVKPYTRYMKISPFGDSFYSRFEFFTPQKGQKVVDDSHYHIRQTPQLIRQAISSGSLSSVGLYDFDDGKDNGFNPVLRKIAPDPVEVDEAVRVIKESAKKAKDEQVSKQQAQEQKDLNDKALKGLSSLSDALQSDNLDSSTE